MRSNCNVSSGPASKGNTPVSNSKGNTVRESLVQDQPYSVPDPVRGAIDRTFEEAERAATLSGSTESRLVLQKLNADYLAIQGDAETARQLAEETYSEAQAMELIMVAEGALEILENRTLWMRFKENYESTRTDPHDWGWHNLAMRS